LFLVTIYQGKQNNQQFGLVENAFIRAVDAKGKEIAKFNLSGDTSLNGMCSMVFAEAYRKDKEWKFRAIGEPKYTDNFVDILKSYT
jgi:stress response protein SCP2